MSAVGRGAVGAWVALARPRLLIPVLALVGLGFGWAHWDRALPLTGGGALLRVLGAWTLLHAGTLWLNAELDRDEGEVLGGRAVPVPPGTSALGFLALALGVGVAVWAGALAAGAALLSALLAVAYSHPRLAWKGHPVGGPAVNLLGYGLLTPLAGWSVVGVAPDLRTLAVLPVVLAGIGGCYLTAQAFQGAEDRARGYRTLVATHGAGVVLAGARGAFAAGWLGLAALCLLGWLPAPLLLALPGGLAVDAALARWARAGGGTVEDAAVVGRRLAWSTLAVLLLATGAHVVSSLSGGPPAGLATSAGLPPDRPVVPAWRLMRAHRAGEGLTP
ncbi:MAG: hypothetical protein H6732_18510 [Alphaproteobacteria bacterium]|nr:hypothetical protein [Alphaproteobacteria bacterium]